ncbi:MAG TPA: hypothetical protein VMZ30_18450 [Pyrinomonadaceae bacterium]|nr:hypothetical protein [Pyrinomonadaceae bacterium]
MPHADRSLGHGTGTTLPIQRLAFRIQPSTQHLGPGVTEKEIAMLLVQNALATQRADPEGYTEANGDPSLKALGNATIANSLEKLGGHGIVADVQPTFGEQGMGFVYRISPNLVVELASEDLVVRLVNGLFDGPPSETSATVADLLAKCEQITINHIYRDDLLASISELRICFAQECYIACLALSGKILEICLKQVLIDNQVEFNDKWTIGRLIGRYCGCECWQNAGIRTSPWISYWIRFLWGAKAWTWATRSA